MRGAVLAIFLLALAGCETSSDGGPGPGATDVSPRDVALADGAAADLVIEPAEDAASDSAVGCDDVACTLTCASDEDCGSFASCVYTGGGCCSSCEPIPCESDGMCPACSTCSGTPAACVPIPCPVECTSDDDCSPGQRCEESSEGCCGRCVEEPPDCAAHDCLATCATDEDCPMGAVCAEYADGCCSACMSFCDDDCFLAGGAYCPPDPSDDACVIVAIQVNEIGPCVFELIATAADGTTDRILVDGCWDFVTNLPANACGIELKHETGDLLVACNWCGQIRYAPELCD